MQWLATLVILRVHKQHGHDERHQFAWFCSNLKVSDMSADKREFLTKALQASRQKLDTFLSYSQCLITEQSFALLLCNLLCKFSFLPCTFIYSGKWLVTSSSASSASAHSLSQSLANSANRQGSCCSQAGTVICTKCAEHYIIQSPAIVTCHIPCP